MFVWLMLFACGTDPAITRAFEEAKTESLQRELTVPARWQPDLRMQLAPNVVEALIENRIEQTERLTQPVDLPMGKLTPSLHLKSVKVGRFRNVCPPDAGCMSVSMELDGEVSVRTPLGNRKTDVEANLVLDVATRVQREGERFVVRAKPMDVRNISVSMGSKKAAVGSLVKGPLRQWLTTILTELKPMEVLELDDTLPIRAARVDARRGITLNLLTDTPSTGTALPTVKAPIRTSFRVWVLSSTVTALASRQSFEAGRGTGGLLPQIKKLDFQGSGVQADLRLWGNGWWRDIDATGSIAIKDGLATLQLEKATPTDSSPGATAANPVAALATTLLPHVVGDLTSTTVPVLHTSEDGKKTINTRLERVQGDDGALYLEGSLSLEALRPPSATARQ